LSNFALRGFFVGVQLLECNASNSLITFVSQAQLLRQHRYPVLLKQSEVVDSSLAKGSTNDLPGRLIDDHLRFQGVLLFRRC
jgi:hypothetical protein